MARFHGPRIVTDGLVLHLDAANARSYPRTGTTMTNLAGNTSITATLTNGPTFNANNSGVIALDGTNDKIEYRNSDLLTLTNFTFSAFMQFNIQTDLRGIIWSEDLFPPTIPSFRGNFFFALRTSDNTLRAVINTSAGWGTQRTASIGVTDYSKFLNPVLTVNGGVLRFYNNGRFLSTVTQGAYAVYDSTYKTSFGARSGDSAYAVSGQFGVGSIYNRALSDAEVLQNFNALRGRYGI